MPTKIINEYKEFIKEYKIPTVAIAFVTGQAVNELVKSFVTNIFMPLINPLLPGETWQTAIWHIGPFAIGWGLFLSNLIYFLILSLIIFIVVKKLLKFKNKI